MPTRRSLSRIVVNVVLDGVLAALCVPCANWVALGHGPLALPGWSWPVAGLALLLAGVPFRLSTQYWRFSGLDDLLNVCGGAIFGGALFSLVLHGAGVLLPSPTFPIVYVLVLAALLGIPRIAYRLMQQGRLGRSEAWRPESAGSGPQPVLLLGAGEGADLFLRALKQERNPPFRPVGLIPLTSRQAGRRIHGCPILGDLSTLGPTLDRLKAAGDLPARMVATEDIGRAELAAVLEETERAGIALWQAPRPTSLLRASEETGRRILGRLDLQPFAIEDLLNRPQVQLDRDGMARLVQGRRVLVTGAGGTIGSELARQVAALGPARLVLLDNGEFALWQIDLELTETEPLVPRRSYIADIRDESRMRAICEQERPELVFHAAALKHVPIVEANPLEGLLTNSAGTKHVADAARAAGAHAMVLISTDKAVNPTSVMGASKRLAEMYCQGLDIAARGRGRGRGTMRCVTVRFGNVLGSTGSVVPLFARQLARGGPLTVTHPDMQRYFMTVREAVGLVLQASVVGTADGLETGEKPGGIFVLDMGPPVKIVDLARQMIKLAGLRPERDVEIRFTGLRPGEKLHEELFHGREPPAPTPFPGLLMASPRTADAAIVGRAIDEIAAACRGGQEGAALSLLGHLVPELQQGQAASRLMT